MKKIRLILLVQLIFIATCYGQIGSEFWFAAPDVSQENSNNSTPLDLHVTALYNTHVSISRPADPSFNTVEFDLNPQQTKAIRLSDILPINEIEVYATDISSNFVQDKGFCNYSGLF